MSPALPVISGADAIRAFARLGYEVSRQKGSHVRLIHPEKSKRAPLTVPLHKELDAGLLRSLIREAGLTVDQFLALR